MRPACLVVALGILAAALAADAQQPGKVARVAYLAPSSPSRQALRDGLRELGWVEGQNLVIESRFAGGKPERLRELAAELVRLRVDVIVTAGTAATLAAKQATRTIPIVFGSVGAAVDKGIVASLARPGGNVTGLELHPQDSGKILQLL